MIAISAAVAIILLTVVTYVLIGRWVHSLFYNLLLLLLCLLPPPLLLKSEVCSVMYVNKSKCLHLHSRFFFLSLYPSLSSVSSSLVLVFFFCINFRSHSPIHTPSFLSFDHIPSFYSPPSLLKYAPDFPDTFSPRTALITNNGDFTLHSF